MRYRSIDVCLKTLQDWLRKISNLVSDMTCSSKQGFFSFRSIVVSFDFREACVLSSSKIVHLVKFRRNPCGFN